MEEEEGQEEEDSELEVVGGGRDGSGSADVSCSRRGLRRSSRLRRQLNSYDDVRKVGDQSCNSIPINSNG